MDERSTLTTTVYWLSPSAMTCASMLVPTSTNVVSPSLTVIGTRSPTRILPQEEISAGEFPRVFTTSAYGRFTIFLSPAVSENVTTSLADCAEILLSSAFALSCARTAAVTVSIANNAGSIRRYLVTNVSSRLSLMRSRILGRFLLHGWFFGLHTFHIHAVQLHQGNFYRLLRLTWDGLGKYLQRIVLLRKCRHPSHERATFVFRNYDLQVRSRCFVFNS